MDIFVCNPTVVVICFKISIFALSDTTICDFILGKEQLWFALKLVSLHYQTQQEIGEDKTEHVVICFKISIFALSDTTIGEGSFGSESCDLL